MTVNGKVVTGLEDVEKGSTVTFQVKAADGYKITSVKVGAKDLVGYDGVYDVVVNDTTTVTVATAQP